MGGIALGTVDRADSVAFACGRLNSWQAAFELEYSNWQCIHYCSPRERNQTYYLGSSVYEKVNRMVALRLLNASWSHVQLGRCKANGRKKKRTLIVLAGGPGVRGSLRIEVPSGTR